MTSDSSITLPPPAIHVRRTRGHIPNTHHVDPQASAFNPVLSMDLEVAFGDRADLSLMASVPDQSDKSCLESLFAYKAPEGDGASPDRPSHLAVVRSKALSLARISDEIVVPVNEAHENETSNDSQDPPNTYPVKIEIALDPYKYQPGDLIVDASDHEAWVHETVNEMEPGSWLFLVRGQLLVARDNHYQHPLEFHWGTEFDRDAVHALGWTQLWAWDGADRFGDTLGDG